jgi:AraC family transcriptional regulator of adaptative response/methylated-DNA-[protein]-cysteine methyltransferase
MSSRTLDQESMWRAVAERDARQDGRFVYGVVTTGVFCRPGCPSRRPRRENVRFHADVQGAMRDGFRPCKRCKPLGAAGDAATAQVLALCRRIEDGLDDRTTLQALGAPLGLSAFQVHRLFRKALGITPKDYRDALRLRRVKSQLREGGSVTEAIYEAGYGSGSRLYERVDGHLGMTPRQYRAGGRGIAISHACGDTALGRVMIGATDRGICFLQFGDDDAALLAQLGAEYPQATLSPMPRSQSAAFDAWMQALAAHLAGRSLPSELPLDVQGTAFQRRVWQFLQRIPAGEVMSYTEVAVALGQPRAARAVASACARNTIGVLIPCHRVVRGDGGLGGYRWGLDRKRALLDAERAQRG